MIYAFPMSGSEHRPKIKNYCLKNDKKTPKEGDDDEKGEDDNEGDTIKVNNKKYLVLNCLEKEHITIQDKIERILELKRQEAEILKEINTLEENGGKVIHRAIYQVGLGGTWSPD